MTEQTKEILDRMGYNITDIHHAVYINTYPENWIKIIHYQGDEIKQNWLFKKIFGPRYYKQTICWNEYKHCKMTLNDVVKEYGKTDKMYYNTFDDVYPIYYHNALHIITKNKYGNPNMCSSYWYIGWLDKNEMLEIVEDINNSVKLY